MFYRENKIVCDEKGFVAKKRLQYWCDWFHVFLSVEMEMKSLSERFPFGKNRNRYSMFYF